MSADIIVKIAILLRYQAIKTAKFCADIQYLSYRKKTLRRSVLRTYKVATVSGNKKRVKIRLHQREEKMYQSEGSE
jgi:hypothetical protein